MRPDDIGSRTVEPCSACGEETAIGSGFYSDRRVVDLVDGRQAFACTLCMGRAAIAAGHGRERLTEEQVQNLAKNGSMAAISYARGM